MFRIFASLTALGLILANQSFASPDNTNVGDSWISGYDEKTGAHSISTNVSPKGRIIFLCRSDTPHIQLIISTPIISKSINDNVFMSVHGERDQDIPNTGWKRMGKKYMSRLFTAEAMKTIASSRLLSFKTNPRENSGGVVVSVFDSGKAAIVDMLKKCSK